MLTRLKRTLSFSFLLGLFFVNVLYAGEYKEINSKEFLIDRASLEGKKVRFQDEFMRLSDEAQNLARHLPRFKDYISFSTRYAGSCYVKKKCKELMMELEKGEKIILYGNIESFSVGSGPKRYSFFVDKMIRVSAEKPGRF